MAWIAGVEDPGDGGSEGLFTIGANDLGCGGGLVISGLMGEGTDDAYIGETYVVSDGS